MCSAGFDVGDVGGGLAAQAKPGALFADHARFIEAAVLRGGAQGGAPCVQADAPAGGDLRPLAVEVAPCAHGQAAAYVHADAGLVVAAVAHIVVFVGVFAGDVVAVGVFLQRAPVGRYLAACVMGQQEQLVASAEAGMASRCHIAGQDDDIVAGAYLEGVAGDDAGLDALQVIGRQQADVQALQGAGQVGDVGCVNGQLAPCRHQAGVEQVAFEFEVDAFGG